MEERNAARDRDITKKKRYDLWQAVCGQRGRRYASCTLENYTTAGEAQEEALRAVSGYANNVDENVQDGKNVVLVGPVGTGKDHLMMAIAKVATVEFGLSVTWENGVDLFAGMRDLIGSNGSEIDFANKLIWPNILAISDPLPPQGELTDFQASLLFRVIDGRYSEMKPTWVTLNVKDPADAARRLTPQIHDRLRHDALRVSCNWESYRG